MNFRSLASFAVPVAAVLSMLVVGCVDIPSEGPTPPDFKAQIRVMYLDPLLTASTNIVVASGPAFSNFQTNVFPAGSFGDPVTAYSTVDAGGKQLFVSPGDADTSALTFATDQRGMLLVLPRPDVVTQPRFGVLGEGRTFEAIGVEDSSQVRFVNTITRSASDTVDVTVDVIQLPDSSVVVSGLPFGCPGIPPVCASDYLMLPADTTVSFYIVRTGTSEVLSDTILVKGASRTNHTLVCSGPSDAVSFDDILTQ